MWYRLNTEYQVPEIHCPPSSRRGEIVQLGPIFHHSISLMEYKPACCTLLGVDSFCFGGPQKRGVSLNHREHFCLGTVCTYDYKQYPPCLFWESVHKHEAEYLPSILVVTPLPLLPLLTAISTNTSLLLQLLSQGFFTSTTIGEIQYTSSGVVPLMV